MTKRHGVSYLQRVADINRIYDEYAKKGVPNREIWRRYVYPVYGVSERTFYNLLNASCQPHNETLRAVQMYLDFNYDDNEQGHPADYTKHPEGYPGGDD